jgi:hypothetical protein
VRRASRARLVVVLWMALIMFLVSMVEVRPASGWDSTPWPNAGRFIPAHAGISERHVARTAAPGGGTGRGNLLGGVGDGRHPGPNLGELAAGRDQAPGGLETVGQGLTD